MTWGLIFVMDSLEYGEEQVEVPWIVEKKERRRHETSTLVPNGHRRRLSEFSLDAVFLPLIIYLSLPRLRDLCSPLEPPFSLSLPSIQNGVYFCYGSRYRYGRVLGRFWEKTASSQIVADRGVLLCFLGPCRLRRFAAL